MSIGSFTPRRLPIRAASSAIALALLSACAVGPDFARPAPIASQHFDRQAEEQLTAGSTANPAQNIDPTRRIDGDWWSIFGSAKLDGMMRKAVDGNLDLVAADATIRQANEAVAAARGGVNPQVDLGAQAGRQRAGGSTGNFYAVGPTVSFDLDLFGGTRRLIEQRGSLAELQRHRFDAAYLTLTGDVARQALLFASAQAQIEAVDKILADDRRNLELVSIGHRYGSATQVDIALVKTQLAQDETLLPPLEQQRDAARHALSVLAGEGPADWTPPEFTLADFTLPTALPLSLPSELAHDRPDILAAEAQLHAVSATIGMATADLYPHLQLTGSLGTAGPGLGTLWSIVSGLAAPIFHGGALKANQRAAMDGYHASVANYRQIVVGSLGQVADILQAVRHDGEEYAAQERALEAAKASLRLNQAGYRAGEVDALRILDAERAYQRALLGEIKAGTARYLDAVQLSIALGGNAHGAFERTRLPSASR